ncbi:MAG: cellulose biosynthesis cyclic di-GMP-binding regulatory protein BcsB [Myxococcota bacterium]
MIALALTLLAGPAHSAEIDEPVAPVESTQMDVTFVDGLYVEKDMMLHGLKGYATVDFQVPRNWELTADPQLNLYFEHSDTLLADQSNLTVLLNNVQISSTSLSSENAKEGVLKIDLPRGSLDEYNILTFAGTHRKTDNCQDPYDMALWTRINRFSKISFTVDPQPIQGELLDYPYPFLDEQGFGAVELTWVVGNQASDDTLTAAATLGFGLGRMADYRGVEMKPAVTDLALVDTNAVLVGTPDEQPLIGQLVDLSEVGNVKGLVGVVPNPHNPALAVLVVTGWTGKDVITAAQALSSNPRFQTMAGPTALVERVPDASPPRPRQVPSPLLEKTATLADMGLKDQTVRGYYAPQFRVPIHMAGDAVVKPSGGVAWLNYGYSAGLDTSLSTMEVRLNGVTLRSVPLDHSGGESQTYLRVRLPAEMMSPHAFLDVAFHLFPEGYESCEKRTDETHWATLYASSEVSIPHDNYAQMPDLGRLRYRGWPFNLEEGPVELVLADNPSGDEISSMFALAARLGAWSIADQPKLTVSTATSAMRSTLFAHQVVLAGATPHKWFNQLVSKGVLSPPGDVSKPGVGVGRYAGVRYIEQRLQADGRDRSIMVLRGDDDAGLSELVNSLWDGRMLSKLDRNLAVFTPSGRVQTSTTQEPQQVGTVPLLTQGQLVVQRNWATWGIIAVIGAMIFALAVQRWALARGGEV